MAVVILAAVGGAFIVAEQLRNDDRRIAELEDAVRQLAEAVAPAIEAPARLRAATVGERASAPAEERTQDEDEPAPPATTPGQRVRKTGKS